MIVDDLRALPSSPLVVAEGSPLPAWAVSTGIAERFRALWLLPPPAFLLAEVIEGAERGSTTFPSAVDGTRPIDGTVAFAEAHFAQALADGPLASSREERRALLPDEPTWHS